MRDAPDTYSAALTGPQISRVTEITSWRGSTYLGTVPISSGTLEVTTDDIPGQLTLTTKATPETIPSHAMHMLASAGQQLRVRRGIAVAGRVAWWFDHGWYRVLPTRPVAGALSIRALPLESYIDTARFIRPSLFPGGTFAGHVRQLCRGIIPVRFAPDITDRWTPARTWEEDRLAALGEVLAAWGGVVGRVAEDAVYTVSREPRSTTPVITITDGPGGTLADVVPAGDDDLVPNAVVVSTAPDDGTVPLSETTYLREGPRAWAGPYGYVVDHFTSPLLTTRPALRTAGATRLRIHQRRASRWDLDVISDDRIQIGDPIRVTRWDGSIDIIGRVEGYQLPLTPADEPGKITISAISGTAYGAPVLEVI